MNAWGKKKDFLITAKRQVKHSSCTVLYYAIYSEFCIIWDLICCDILIIKQSEDNVQGLGDI